MKKYIKTFPVSLQTENISYDSNAKLIFFPDKDVCERWKPDDKTPDSKVFIPALLKNLKTNPCTSSWAMVAKGNKRLTPCSPLTPDNDRFILKLTAEKIEGKRLLIVIANSKILSEAGRGKTIQKAIIEWLKNIKESNKRLPLNIFIIKDDKEVREILTGEELARLSLESQDTNNPSIVGKIYGNLTFTGDGFQPLREISSVGRQTRDKQIEKVLFFTDSYYLPQIPDDLDLGMLMGWKIDGIEVTVVTESNCDRWQTREELVDCRILKQYPNVDDVSLILDTLKLK